MMRQGSVQKQYIALREVKGPVMRLRLPSGGSGYRSVMEVTGTHFNLLDEDKQEMVYELYHRLFLALDFPLQIMVRVRELNVEAYLQYVEPESVQAGWQRLAADHASFLRKQVERHPLLGRRFYLAFPADEPTAGPLRKRHQDQLAEMSAAAQQLKTRYETLSYHLRAIGLSCRLLADGRLVQFYRSFLLPVVTPLSLDVVGHPTQATGGTRSTKKGGSPRLEDLLAPGVVEAMWDMLAVENVQCLRVQHIDALPRMVSFGWLKNMIEVDETFDLVHQIIPRPESLSYLRRQNTQAKASLLFEKEGRTVDPRASVAHRDLEPLLEQVASEEELMMDSSIHLIIRATSAQELERRTARVMSRANAVFGHRPRTCYFEQAQAIRACAPGSMTARETMLLPSSVITTMMPFFDHTIFQPRETSILEGITEHNEPVILDIWDLPNANRLILGPPGFGKSMKEKMDAVRLHTVYKHLVQRRGKNEDGFQILFVDPERETSQETDFNLIEYLGGESIRFSPGSPHHLNPLDLPPVSAASADEREDVLATHIGRLHRVFDCMLAHTVDDKGATLLPDEKSELEAALYECYRRAGIDATRKTHNRPAPLLRDLYEVLMEDESHLARRLRRYTHGSLAGLFSGPTNIKLDATVVQFDVREMESELRPTGLMLISQHIWNCAFTNPIPRFLYIDELATVGRYKAGQDFLEELFQRSRKHGLSVTGITQHAKHLSESIIANCSSHILMHQDDTSLKYIKEMFQLSDRECQLLRSFSVGEALMLVNGKRLVVRFVPSPLELKVMTTNRRHIAAMQEIAGREAGGLYATLE